MTEQRSGLRFDIFERVHLTEELDGMENLDEIELVPHIELSTQGQQTILKGYLQLAGSYSNTRNENQSVDLDHRIPVNISMPSERIENIDQLGVEIDHFDVDLLSSRMLNVTGVLYLRGVQAADTRPSRPPETNEEEMLFVHQAFAKQQAEQIPDMRQSEEVNASSSQAEASSEQPLPQAQPQEKEQKQAGAEAKAEPQVLPQPLPQPQTQAQSEENVPLAPSNEPPVSNESFEPSITPEVQATEHQTLENQAEENLIVEENEPLQAKPEMKIAFSGKQTASNDLMNASELQSLLQQNEAANPQPSESSEQAAKAQKDRAESDSAQASISDRVQWKNLFLPKEEDESQQFRKVRVCIVQKEETLDSIAERYSLNPREILLYNRLGEQQEVSEGQVIYIPRTS